MARYKDVKALQQKWAKCWDDAKLFESNADEKRKTVMDELSLVRYCYKSQFLSHVDLIDTANYFKKF